MLAKPASCRVDEIPHVREHLVVFIPRALRCPHPWGERREDLFGRRPTKRSHVITRRDEAAAGMSPTTGSTAYELPAATGPPSRALPASSTRLDSAPGEAVAKPSRRPRPRAPACRNAFAPACRRAPRHVYFPRCSDPLRVVADAPRRYPGRMWKILVMVSVLGYLGAQPKVAMAQPPTSEQCSAERRAAARRDGSPGGSPGRSETRSGICPATAGPAS